MTTFIPVAHGLVRYGWAVQAERIALRWIVATLVLNTMGAGAYAAKVSGFCGVDGREGYLLTAGGVVSGEVASAAL
jgi:hypothetical protein